MSPHHPPRWRRAFVACLSGLAAFASAATTTTKAPASTTSVAPEGPQTHTVLVGSGGDTQYHPNTINANVGDTVSFQFYPTNHSVIRGVSSASNLCGSGGCNPCVPVELINQKVPPFASKNFLTQDLPSPANLAAQSFNLTINDTQPIWFYCDAISSCLNGMVGVINPENGSSIDTQIAAAKAAKFQLGPGQPWPAEGVLPGAETATQSVASPTSTSNSTSSGSATTHDHRLTGGAIAGIAVGAAAVVILCAALCYFVGRANTYRDVLRTNKPQSEGGLPSHYGDGTGSMPTPAPPPPMSPVDPAMHSPPAFAGAWDQHRFSGQTQFSAVPPSMMEQAALPAGTFIGYNRMTGAPEFAQEAPTLAPGDGEHYHDDSKLTPPPQQMGFHGPQEPNVVTQHTHELPGETPPIAEVGPYK